MTVSAVVELVEYNFERLDGRFIISVRIPKSTWIGGFSCCIVWTEAGRIKNNLLNIKNTIAQVLFMKSPVSR